MSKCKNCGQETRINKQSLGSQFIAKMGLSEQYKNWLVAGNGITDICGCTSPEEKK